MQALIITAYTDYFQLCELVFSMREDFLIYIHVDKKNKLPEEIARKLNHRNVHIYSIYSVTWGSINHILALIYLLDKAIANRCVSYIHTISGQDFPTKKKQFFYDTFADKKIYMSVIRKKDFNEYVRERYEYYHVLKNCDLKNDTVKKIDNTLLFIQKALRIKRKRIGSFQNICKGLVWVSIPREAAEYVLEYNARHPEFMHALGLCALPEEFFFQTILMNSCFSSNIVNNDLRFVDWGFRYDSCPCILDASDFDRICRSNCVFARKMQTEISCDLVTRIKQEILDA